jgi:hypothetical protein
MTILGPDTLLGSSRWPDSITDEDLPPIEEAPLPDDDEPIGQREKTRRIVLKLLLEGEPPAPPALQTDRFTLVGDITLLGGGGDAGKTTAMVTAGVCTPIGRPLFGTLAIKRTGPVVFIVPEDGEAVIRHHAEAIMTGLDVTDVERATLTRHLHIVGDDRRFNLLTSRSRRSTKS